MFVPGKPLQPSLMFVGKARGLPWSGAPVRCLIWIGSGFTCKHETMLERLTRDKHSSLLQKSVNYGRKKFYSTGPRGVNPLCWPRNQGKYSFYWLLSMSLAFSTMLRRTCKCDLRLEMEITSHPETHWCSVYSLMAISLTDNSSLPLSSTVLGVNPWTDIFIDS